MLDMATVLTTMFVYIDDFCKSQGRRLPGPRPTLADSEIVTIALFCELMGKSSDYEQVRFAGQWLRGYFPRMVDRSQYHRRRRGLTRLINRIRERTRDDISMETADVHVIDSTPIPVMSFRRAGFTPLFPEAAYGHCAARRMTYFGFKLHLVVDRNGIPIHFDLTPANVSDGSMSEEMLSVSSAGRTVLGDRGYLSGPVRERLLGRYGISLHTPSRQNQKRREPKAERRLLNGWRQIVEVVNCILKTTLDVERTLAKTLAGLVTRVTAKVAALTLAIYLNKLFRREPLAVASLVA